MFNIGRQSYLMEYGIVPEIVKTSTMVFYMRIIGTERNFRIQVTITMVIVWAWSASMILKSLPAMSPLKVQPGHHH